MSDLVEQVARTMSDALGLPDHSAGTDYFREAAAQAIVAITDAQRSWSDREDDLTEAIDAHHPFVTRDYDTYHRAMDLVGNRRSKGALVGLVAYLLGENKRLKGETP